MLPQSGIHKDWLKARVDLHVTTSLMRLLYLVESFVDSANKFNAVACAIHIKAMAEIPMHLGYINWVLYSHNSFGEIKEHLHKIAFGNRSKESGLTKSAKVSQKDLYKHSDEMLKKFFKHDQKSINMMERLYKEANATGHNNYEGRMLTGVQHGDTWTPRDRKEWFVFYSSNIFQFFLHCDLALGVSSTFLKAIDHYFDEIPDYLKGDVIKTKTGLLSRVMSWVRSILNVTR
jgi:hypothetical protein